MISTKHMTTTTCRAASRACMYRAELQRPDDPNESTDVAIMARLPPSKEWTKIAGGTFTTYAGLDLGDGHTVPDAVFEEINTELEEIFAEWLLEYEDRPRDTDGDDEQ